MDDRFLRVNESLSDLINRCTNLSAFDCSEEEMLWVTMGPRRLPLSEIVPISMVLAVIFVTGAVGNAAVCAVIARHKTMHTATNYYLFSLAVSDLLLLLAGLPNDLTVYWHQYPYSLGVAFCKMRALVSEAASYVSILTIVAFSLERYLAICHPLHLYAMAGLRRALRIVAAVWALSLLAASPFALYTTVNYRDYPPGSGNLSLESAFCGMLELPSWHLCELSTLLFFVLPGLIILLLYVRMGMRIRSTHASKPGSPGTLNGVNGSVHGEARQAQSKKAIIRMLAAVVIAFYVCWAPFHCQRLFYIYGASSPHYQMINEHLFNVAGALYYVSATVNPILYNVMSHRYRLAFKETLCCGRTTRTKASLYRDHSSVRESSVNHTEGTQLVRVRSQLDRRNRVQHTVFRRCSFHTTEMAALCGGGHAKWHHDCPKGNENGSLKLERGPLCNNNGQQPKASNERASVSSGVDSDPYRLAFKETLCCGRTTRTKASLYRDHSSVRESSVNHTEGTQLVRVRSQLDRRNRVQHTVFRRCSFHTTEMAALCGGGHAKWHHDCPKGNENGPLKLERGPLCNNNGQQPKASNERASVSSGVDSDPYSFA